ncbi:MAG: pyridoxamine 5'-phosphate oxidase [Pseudomonadota bacterium]|nr:pyridoxamine 5'-phosphate oxidase [Pseudomonadota bacterium]
MELFEASKDLDDPILKAYEWIKEAEESSVALPHAMNLASLNSEGKPTSRMVLLKRISNEGFVFFTDYEGNKGEQISKSPYVALNFWWAKTNKQIRIEGTCSKVTNEENDAYFLSRPRGSQISASVSFQSKEISSYEDLVERSKAFEEENLNKEIQRPARWGGFILTPDSIEFWIDQRNRLHKRYLYTKEKKDWKKTLLSP